MRFHLGASLLGPNQANVKGPGTSLDAEGKWANELVNINDPLATEGVLMDITNIQLGWLRFEGQVDIQTQHHSLGPIPQPSDFHKEGIKLEVWLPKSTSEGSLV